MIQNEKQGLRPSGKGGRENGRMVEYSEINQRKGDDGLEVRFGSVVCRVHARGHA